MYIFLNIKFFEMNLEKNTKFKEKTCRNARDLEQNIEGIKFKQST